MFSHEQIHRNWIKLVVTEEALNSQFFLITLYIEGFGNKRNCGQGYDSSNGMKQQVIYNWPMESYHSKSVLCLCFSVLLTIDINLISGLHNRSRDVRKPDFCICENKDADQLRGNREADQRLCFRYIDSTIPLLPKSEISSLQL